MSGRADSGQITNSFLGSACRNFRTTQSLTRREVLRVGGLASFGLSLPGMLQARDKGAASTSKGGGAGTFGKAKQVIVLYLHGGHPQQETFDPKPRHFDCPTNCRTCGLVMVARSLDSGACSPDAWRKLACR